VRHRKLLVEREKYVNKESLPDRIGHALANSLNSPRKTDPRRGSGSLEPVDGKTGEIAVHVFGFWIQRGGGKVAAPLEFIQLADAVQV
jgi:hypothetical protein